MAYNGLQIGVVGDLYVLTFSLAQMEIKKTNVQLSTSAPITPNCCCMPFFIFHTIRLAIYLGLQKK